jgi:hypothetical protein
MAGQFWSPLGGSSLSLAKNSGRPLTAAGIPFKLPTVRMLSMTQFAVAEPTLVAVRLSLRLLVLISIRPHGGSVI